MSLLLDALKKAADDKQKASQQGSASTTEKNQGIAESKSDTSVASDAASKKVIDSSSIGSNAILSDNDTTENTIDQTSKLASTDDYEELTLDAIDSHHDAGGQSAQNDDSQQDSGHQEIAGASSEVSGVEALSLNKTEEAETTKASYTVSDEALSMLIYKTNHVVKHGRRAMVAGVLLASLLVLAAGGFYYYTDTQAEIAALERKHNIAMQSMRLKTRQDKIPPQSEIIRNLVSESDLDDKVLYAKKHMTQTKNQQRKSQVAIAGVNNNAVTAVSFQRTTKVDPVTQKLALAWAAYNAAEYPQAKTLYQEVLKIEKNNRDALLGMGAIAVLEENNDVARFAYSSLLKSDPGDPIAIAALANLKQTETLTTGDEQHLLKMVKKNPADAHLNFALGNVYAQQGKWKQAQQSYFNAWQGDSNNADYLFNLAVSLDQLGQQKQALTFYRESLKKAVDRNVTFSRKAVEKRVAEISRLQS